MNNQVNEVSVAVLPLNRSGQADTEKHVVTNVIPQPRPTDVNDGTVRVVTFKVAQKQGTVIKHTVHGPILAPAGKHSSTTIQEPNPLNGMLEDTND